VEREGVSGVEGHNTGELRVRGTKDTFINLLQGSIPSFLSSQATPKPKHRIALPPELTDDIINHLRSDREALAMCSLVCKAWLPASRYHLFQVAFFQMPISKRRLELLKSSMCVLVPYARCLHIKQVAPMAPGAIDELAHLLTPLLHVETLRLSDLDIRDLYPVVGSITSAFAVTRLELYDVIFQDVNELSRFVSYFTCLRRLDICPQFRQVAQLASPISLLPAGVSSVGYTVGISGGGSEICDWITLSTAQIRLLDIGLYSALAEDGHILMIGNLLKTLEPSLQHLNISFISGLSEGSSTS
jgi:hypothetical protein